MTSKKLILVLIVLVAIVGLVMLAKKGVPTISKGVHIEETTTTYTITVDVASTKNPALNASVKEYAEFRAREFAEMYARSMFTDEEFEALGFARGTRYELSIKGESWSFERLSGMTLEVYTFTGGAHGAATYIPFIHDDNGLPVTLSDLFVSESPYLVRLSSLVQEPLRQQLKENQVFNETSFSEGTSPSEGNFFVDRIDDSGITFVFQQYQVAPYVAGAPRITISLSELADILNPEYF